MSFTEVELEYVSGQRLGRLATVSPDGVVQNNPVGFRVNQDGSLDVGGMGLRKTKKARNIAAGSSVALVVDDVVFDPFTARGIEIRGTAELLSDVEPPMSFQDREVIRIRPRRIITWGLESEGRENHARDV